MSHIGELCWETVAGLLGTLKLQMAWKPQSVIWSEPDTPIDLSAAFSVLQAHYKYHDENYDEAGKLPLMSVMLSATLSDVSQSQEQGLLWLSPV